MMLEFPPSLSLGSLGLSVSLEELIIPNLPEDAAPPSRRGAQPIPPASERERASPSATGTSDEVTPRSLEDAAPPTHVPVLARERLWQHGADRVSDEELVGILLGTGMRGRSVWNVASDVVRAAGGLPALSRATPQELIHTAGIGECRAVRMVAAFELGRRAMFAKSVVERLQAPEDVARLLMPRVSGSTQERFFVLGLDVRNQLVDMVEVARGALNEVAMYPREVFRPLIRMAAATAVIAHNHPSGDPTPSHEDLALTLRLRAVGDVVGIPVMDHIVIGGSRYRSILEWAGTTL